MNDVDADRGQQGGKGLHYVRLHRRCQLQDKETDQQQKEQNQEFFHSVPGEPVIDHC